MTHTLAPTAPAKAPYSPFAPFPHPEPLLTDILGWARPHGSKTEKRFCRSFLDTIPGMVQDAFGNRMIRIGDAPVLWSCHVDTVAKHGGPQALAYDRSTGLLGLDAGKPGMSLGADDGAGIWIMLCMIAAQRPGLYVFHRGEEVGCLGSRWIVQNTPGLLQGLSAAIAFDRAGLGDVITRQMSGVTASDTFALSLATALNEHGPADFAYQPDDGGVYTDTNEYAGLIPECTNLSVGYYGQHGPRERLDVPHCTALRDAMLSFDCTSLAIERTPGDYGHSPADWDDWLGGGVHTGPDDFEGMGIDDWRTDALQTRKALRSPHRGRNDEMAQMRELVEDHPEIAAELLMSAGYTPDDVLGAAWGGAL